MVFYASSPESGSDGESTANLENDTEKKRAKGRNRARNRAEDSEDSKELNIERC